MAPTRVTWHSAAKLRIRACVYSRATVPGVASTLIIRLFDSRGSRFYGRHCAHEGKVRPARPQGRQHQRRSRMTGHHHHIGPVQPDQPFHQGHHPVDEVRFAQRPIGKHRIVGRIKVMRARPQPDDLGKHREAAKP